MLAVTIDASDAGRVLTVFGEKLGDLTQPFTKIGELVFEDARGAIVSQGTVFGLAWGDMQPRTSIVATKLYGKGRDPRTLLQDTRGLLNSLTPGNPDNVLEAGPQEATYGSAYRSSRTGFAIAKYQQEGTSRTFDVLYRRRGVVEDAGYPGRPFLAFREQRRGDFEEILAAHVLGTAA